MMEIFKIQKPIVGSENALVYNDDRSVMRDIPLNDELLELLNGEYKVYVRGEIVDGQLEIYDYVDGVYF